MWNIFVRFLNGLFILVKTSSLKLVLFFGHKILVPELLVLYYNSFYRVPAHKTLRPGQKYTKAFGVEGMEMMKTVDVISKQFRQTGAPHLSIFFPFSSKIKWAKCSFTDWFLTPHEIHQWP